MTFFRLSPSAFRTQPDFDPTNYIRHSDHGVSIADSVSIARDAFDAVCEKPAGWQLARR